MAIRPDPPECGLTMVQGTIVWEDDELGAEPGQGILFTPQR
jgi:hypothetical protein